jgi:hypothetical protein
VNSPPPKPEVILTNFFAEPTVLLVPITSRDKVAEISSHGEYSYYGSVFIAFEIFSIHNYC